MSGTEMIPAPLEPILVGKGLEGVLQEYRLQVGAIDSQESVTLVAMDRIRELHRAGALAKQDVMTLLAALDETTEFPPPFDGIWRQALRDQVIDFVDQLHKCLRLGAQNMMIEVARDPYVPPIPPRQPGLLERLLGQAGWLNDEA